MKGKDAVNLKKILTTIDTHTAGGPTRTLIAGLPPLPGSSVAEKMDYFRVHYDSVRKLLMLEPRGHRDMSGAVLTQPCDPEANLGAFFLTSRGYLRACVHSSIGLATAGLETGFIPRESISADGSIKLEIPAGVVSLLPEYRGDKLEAMAMRTQPAFLYADKEELHVNSRYRFRVTIAFSGVFFLLIDVTQFQRTDLTIVPENAARLAALGVEILEAANRRFQVRHPENPNIRSLEMLMLYEDLDDYHARDIVIGQSGGVDRSPCGAGTGAKMVCHFANGSLAINQKYTLESFLGTRFTGRIVGAAQVGQFPGGVPEITGTAFITGMHQFVVEENDPLKEGFLF